MARKNWIDKVTRKVLPVAFMRRPAPKDDKGLSVDVESACSCHGSLRDCFGVASLHVGRVRALALDIVVDAPPHANITGLPREAENAAEAEHLARELAKQSRVVPAEQYMELR